MSSSNLWFSVDMIVCRGVVEQFQLHTYHLERIDGDRHSHESSPYQKKLPKLGVTSAQGLQLPIVWKMILGHSSRQCLMFSLRCTPILQPILKPSSSPTPWKFKSRNNKPHIKLVSLPQRSLKRPQIMKFLWYLPRSGHRRIMGGVHSVSRRPRLATPSRERSHIPPGGKGKSGNMLVIPGRRVHNYQLCVFGSFFDQLHLFSIGGWTFSSYFPTDMWPHGRCEVSNHWRSPKTPPRKVLEQKKDMQRGKSSRHDSENIGKTKKICSM